jgi:hypothetical protein
VNETDDRRPAWGILLAVVAVVVGIVTISVVGPNLPHRDDTGAVPSAPTTSAATTSTTSLRSQRPERTLAPGWESFATTVGRHYDAVVGSTDTRLIVFGGSRLMTYPLERLPSDGMWTGVAIDPVSGAVQVLPASPMCESGQKPAGIWTGEELVVWSAFDVPEGCPPAAAYSADTNSWRVLDSDFFRQAGREVVWTGQEILSTVGFAYRPDLGMTREIPLMATSPAFTGSLQVSRPHVSWSGTEMLALGSEGVVRLNPSSGELVDGPPPPLWDVGRSSAWIGDGLLAVDANLDAAVYHPATDEWESIPSVPFLGAGCLPTVVAGEGLGFVKTCKGIAVWDGSGEWKVLPLPRYFNDPDGYLAVANGDLYQIGDGVLRYPLPELVEGVMEQPRFLPVGEQFLDLPYSWQVAHTYVESADGRRTVGVEVKGVSIGTCRVETTLGQGYIPAYTRGTTLLTARGAKVPVGVIDSDGEGLVHVVENLGSGGIVDVVCSDLPDAEELAGRLWSPYLTPTQLPPGETACHVELQTTSTEGDESTEIIVQMRLLGGQECSLSDNLILDFGSTPLPIQGDPVTAGLLQTLSPQQPYLIATYVWRNWCGDPRPARVEVGDAQVMANFDATCLDEAKPSTLALTHIEGPTATPTVEP